MRSSFTIIFVFIIVLAVTMELSPTLSLNYMQREALRSIVEETKPNIVVDVQVYCPMSSTLDYEEIVEASNYTYWEVCGGEYVEECAMFVFLGGSYVSLRGASLNFSIPVYYTPTISNESLRSIGAVVLGEECFNEPIQ